MMYSHHTLDDMGRYMRKTYEEQGARERMAHQAMAASRAEAVAGLKKAAARAKNALAALKTLKSKLSLIHNIG